MTTTSRKRAQARQGHRLLTGSLSLLLVSSAAVARPPGGAYASAVCNPDGYDVCQVPSGTDRWVCSAAKIDLAGADTYRAYMVYDSATYDTGEEPLCDGYDYCAWGYASAAGTPTNYFFCGFTASGEKQGWLVGTEYRDELYFHFSTNIRYNMTGGGGLSVGKMWGDASDDDLHGSKACNGLAEYIYGDAGSDDIWSHGGADDHAWGGSGADNMWGGPGPDELHGGVDDDQIMGGRGDDDIYGDDDADQLNGGPGNDTIRGGDGNDNLCGRDGNDTLQGLGGNDDQVHVGYPAAHADSADGGPGASDDCYPGGSTGCEGDLASSAEPTCPEETGYSDDDCE